MYAKHAGKYVEKEKGKKKKKVRFDTGTLSYHGVAWVIAYRSKTVSSPM